MLSQPPGCHDVVILASTHWQRCVGQHGPQTYLQLVMRARTAFALAACSYPTLSLLENMPRSSSELPFSRPGIQAGTIFRKVDLSQDIVGHRHGE